MKKTLIAIMAVTLLSGIYVYQNARLLEYSYSINASKKSLSLLIDRNRTLRYNVSRLESPARLEKAMTAQADTQAYMPLDCYSVKIKEPVVRDVAIVAPTPLARAGQIMLGMFSLSTEAVAEELK